MEQKGYLANVFVSCSLSEIDKPFVDYICSILRAYRLKPFGTVGKFSASTDNPVDLMDKNIKKADFVVICGTTRYFQENCNNGGHTNGMSEMIHSEAGMAFASGKPIVVFMEKGTNCGSFITNITQYVELDRREETFLQNKILISSLLQNAYEKMKKQRRKQQKSIQERENLQKWATVGKSALLVGAVVLVTYSLIKFSKK